MILLLPINHWLRTTPFIIADTALVLALVNIAGGGYRNIFSLYSLIPSVTAALALPSAERPFRRSLLLAGVVVMSTVGFATSLFVDGYTPSVIIELRQVDEVVLRSASDWVTGGLLAALAAMMIAWQYSRDRANVLREQTAVEEERRPHRHGYPRWCAQPALCTQPAGRVRQPAAGRGPSRGAEEMSRVVGVAGEVHEGIRWIVRALRQDPGSTARLAERLRRIADRFERNTGMAVELRLPARDLFVPVDAIRHLGYIVTEALANTWKHAGAARAP